MRVMVKDFITGDTAASYEDGKICMDAVLCGINKGEKVIIDFSGIEYVIAAFLNPVIGDLILQKGTDVMKQIELVNVNQKALDKIRMVKEGALVKLMGAGKGGT